MVEHALEIGANAILGFRYDASEVVSKGSATEVLCYGTAVVIEPMPETAEEHQRDVLRELTSRAPG